MQKRGSWKNKECKRIVKKYSNEEMLTIWMVDDVSNSKPDQIKRYKN